MVDEYSNKWWCVEGQCHREDGPAIERVNGDKYWYVEGKLHRDPKDGFVNEYSANEYVNNHRNEYWEFD